MKKAKQNEYNNEKKRETTTTTIFSIAKDDEEGNKTYITLNTENIKSTTAKACNMKTAEYHNNNNLYVFVCVLAYTIDATQHTEVY